MGFDRGRDSVICLDAATGSEIWRVSYPSAKYGRYAIGDQGLYLGVTSTPEFDEKTGYLYTLGTDGDLNCWDTRGNGRRIWGMNLYEEFNVPQRPKACRSSRKDYGYTSSPLLVGDWLIVEVGAPAGNLMGFDKRNGRLRWTSQSKSPAGHNGGPVPIDVQGVPCVAVHNHDGLLVVRLDKGNEGKTVATWPWETSYAQNIATVAVHENNVLLTSSYNHHKIARFRISLRGATQVWEQREASRVCTPVIYDGHVYWAWGRVMCLDFETGEVRWQGGRVGHAGSCIVTSDGRLIVWGNRGDLLLVETARRSPNRYTQLATRTGLARSDPWPHVVLADGRLYCKDRSGSLSCFDLRETSSTPAAASVAGVARPRSSNRKVPPAQSPKGAGSLRTEFPDEKEPVLTSWPGDRAGVVFAWDRTFGARVLGPNEKPSTWTFAARGSARATKNGAIDLTGGAAIIEGADEMLLSAFKDESQFSLETVITAANDTQRGPARIVSFSTDAYSRNFTFGQERSWLIFRLRASRAGTKEVKLCQIEAGRRYHVIVSYREGQLIGYLNGKAVNRSSAVQGDFSNWTPHHLLLGDEWNGGRNWDGTIERMAICTRSIGPNEAKQRFELCESTAE